MKKMQQAQPEFTTDADGQQLVHVALANTQQRATLYAEDYRRWIDAGFSRHWSLNDNGNGCSYVKADGRRADGRKTKLRVARLIAGAGKGEHVRFADGNTLNLRADNLRIQRARARYGCSDLLPNAAAVDAARELVVLNTGTNLKCSPQISGGSSSRRHPRASPRTRVINRAPLRRDVKQRAHPARYPSGQTSGRRVTHED